MSKHPKDMILAKVYAPLYRCPAQPSDTGFYGYDQMKHDASRIHGYLRIGISLDSALALARQSPYPDGVKVGIMKMIANDNRVSLEQLRIMLGWAARRAQHTGR